MATALIQQDDAVFFRVEITAMVLVATGTGAAVQKHHRQAPRVPRLLHIEGVNGVHRKAVAAQGLDFRIKRAHDLAPLL